MILCRLMGHRWPRDLTEIETVRCERCAVRVGDVCPWCGEGVRRGAPEISYNTVPVLYAHWGCLERRWTRRLRQLRRLPPGVRWHESFALRDEYSR